MNILSFQGRYQILHLTWFAFFLSFVVWFNMAPFETTIMRDMGLEADQMRTLGICNVALTVPARILIGMALDRYGPRLTYSALLIYAAIPCFIFALADNFTTLVIGRLLLGIVGAGFVIGIRMVSEWFPPREIGVAEGIYGGWGNFGSAAAAFTLPTVALALGFMSPELQYNWRLAIMSTGVIAAVYGVIYFLNVQDTPPGRVYQRPERNGGMEVTSKRDFWFSLLMNIPLVGILGVLAWRLTRVEFLSQTQFLFICLGLLALYAYQSWKAWDVNKALMTGRKSYPAEDRYPFKQVAILQLTYVVNFGAELAVVSMLPAFFERTFELDPARAGMIAASFAFMNLMSRPGGGIISDKMGSRKWTMAILLIAMGIGFLVMSGINNSWFLPLAVVVTMACSFFVQASEGSTYAIVPLIKRRVTGQIAGSVGAYGNVGAVAYLTTYSLMPAGVGADRSFFQILGIAGLIVGFLCVFFLKEPKGSFAEFHEGEEELEPVASSASNAKNPE